MNQFTRNCLHERFQGDELYHHGILGMHWGIRRYQPYGIGYDAKHTGKFVGDKKAYRKAVKDIRSTKEEAKLYEVAVREADKAITKYTNRIQKLEQNPKHKKELERVKTDLSSAKTAAELLQRCQKTKLKEIKSIENKTGIDSTRLKKGFNGEKVFAGAASGLALASFVGLAAATAPFLSVPAVVASSVGGLIGGLSLPALAMSTASVGANRYSTAFNVVTSLINKGIKGKDISSMPIHEFMQLYDDTLRKASSSAHQQAHMQQLNQQTLREINNNMLINHNIFMNQINTEIHNQINMQMHNQIHTDAINTHMNMMGFM